MMLPPKYTKRYKRKYLGWLQGETRKLHKISEDKNLTESVHRKIMHGVRNSLATSCGFAWCVKFLTVCEIVFHSVMLSILQLLLFLISHAMWNFCIAMRKCWLLDFFLWFSFLHLWLAWQPISKLGKGLWSAPKLEFFMYLSFNLHCHGFELLKTLKLAKKIISNPF